MPPAARRPTPPPGHEKLSREDILGRIAGLTHAYPGKGSHEAVRARITVVLLFLFFLLHVFAITAIFVLALLGREEPGQAQLFFQITSTWGVLVGAAVGYYVRQDRPAEDP